MTPSRSRPIRIFTPSYADAANTNAQNLTVKEIIARLPENEFHVTMLSEGGPDPRIRWRKNTRLVGWRNHGNTLNLLSHCLLPPADIYFFPRSGPLDRIFFDLKKRMRLRTALITYIVMAMDVKTATPLIRRAVLEGDRVIGNSQYVSKTVTSLLGVGAATIHDAADPRYFFPAPEPRNPETVTVLYAGSFQPRKRVELVIQQAARFPRLAFRLAGKGETEAQCRGLAQNLGCRNITFLGHLSSLELGDEMRRADIFLFPSIVEGNPQVLLQAAACQLPCIAMNLYHSDYVVNGKTGFLVQSDREMSERLRQLVADSALRRAFAEAAAEHSRRFDWENITMQWAAVFQNAVSRRRPQQQLQAS